MPFLKKALGPEITKKKKNQHEADLGSFPFLTQMQKMVQDIFIFNSKNLRRLPPRFHSFFTDIFFCQLNIA